MNPFRQLQMIMLSLLLSSTYPAKVVKTEWDTTGRGVQVVASAQDAEDIIPMNR